MNYKSGEKYLGIDWGEVRIGLALADGETKIATPFKVVANLEEVLRVIDEEEIDLAVLGKPLRITDYELIITNEKFNDFVKLLRQKAKIPVKLVDERLSSKAADALVGSKKTNPPSPRLRRASASRDTIAAMLILQTWIDREEHEING